MGWKTATVMFGLVAVERYCRCRDSYRHKTKRSPGRKAFNLRPRQLVLSTTSQIMLLFDMSNRAGLRITHYREALSTTPFVPCSSCTHFPSSWRRRSNHFVHQFCIRHYYSLSVVGQDGGSRRRRSRTTVKHSVSFLLPTQSSPIFLATLPMLLILAMVGWRITQYRHLAAALQSEVY